MPHISSFLQLVFIVHNEKLLHILFCICVFLILKVYILVVDKDLHI
jgi:hypothetical protein